MSLVIFINIAVQMNQCDANSGLLLFCQLSPLYMGLYASNSVSYYSMLWRFPPRPSSTIYVRLLFGCSSDYYLTNSTNIQILRRQCCLLLILPSTFSFFSSIIFFPTKKARLHNLWDILQAWVEPSSQRESAGELLIIPHRLLHSVGVHDLELNFRFLFQ